MGRMTEEWKYLVKEWLSEMKKNEELSRENWALKYALKRVKEHRAEFSVSQPIEWVQDLDTILGVMESNE